MFTHQFVAGKRQKKTSLHLMGVKQEKNESLADYNKRFNEESLKVSDLQDAVAFATLMSGLQPGRLRWTLAESEVKTFSEAMAKAQRFIQEADICRHSEEGSKKRKEEGSHRDQPKRLKTGGRSDRFTDHGNDPRFNKNRREIFLDIKNKSMLPHPPPIRTSAYRRDKSQWCEYHQECGHTTKDCRELKKDLDNLADQGKLNRYLKHTSKEKGKQKVGQSNSGDTEGFIGVIAGGFASGGLTGRARKSHLQNLKHQVLEVKQSRSDCPIMTFGESSRSVSVPHDDTLVIELKVANSRVKRVLVDSGSSADIITLDCLKKLKYYEKDVTLLDQPLIGFGGNSVHPVRSIKLPTRMGEKGKGRSLPIDFLVVDIPLPYNIIMGRLTLNKTKAAISTYQLLMQFETDEGKVGKILTG
ncbi:uncharacterized protein LOC104908051 [Beta vulgaris subsp. vulgaris]|uniref:uncharacterized protein LOC104908051 n=1 Tax=Beta vulgaris subsp. vulgaris TaxID=3555 RepID=UPI002037212F|nr:uncharacterized protein LOC104908051 [Beta vulgaris subsp. vulgaris]